MAISIDGTSFDAVAAIMVATFWGSPDTSVGRFCEPAFNLGILNPLPSER
jgi:hypothetical protein